MIRHFVEEDYKLLLLWWAGWKATPVPQYLLPNDGYINDNACAFVLKTHGPVAFIEAVVSSPSCQQSDRDKDLDEVVDHCMKKLKEDGYNFIYALTKNRAVVDRAMKHGFILNDCFVLLQREI